MLSGGETADTGDSGAVELKTANVPGVGGEMGECMGIGGSTVLSCCVSSQSENRSDARVISCNCTGGLGGVLGVSKSPSAFLMLLNLELSSSR